MSNTLKFLVASLAAILILAKADKANAAEVERSYTMNRITVDEITGKNNTISCTYDATKTDSFCIRVRGRELAAFFNFNKQINFQYGAFAVRSQVMELRADFNGKPPFTTEYVVQASTDGTTAFMDQRAIEEFNRIMKSASKITVRIQMEDGSSKTMKFYSPKNNFYMENK